MAIYFDNAATTPMDEAVKTSILPFLNGQFGNPSAIHSIGRPVRAAVEKSRKTIAGHLNASPAEIFFTSGGTEANNTILLGCVRDLEIKHIITSPIEHHCILHFSEYLQKDYGIQRHLLSVNDKGHIDPEELRTLLASIKEKTLVCLMHSNNEIGTMIDIDKIAHICKEYNALFHSDTVQTLGYYNFDLQKTPIDFLVCSAHKLHGPKGVGCLYIRGDHKISPLLYGGSQERNMRAGTENVIGIVGLGKAVEIAYASLEEKQTYIQGLKKYLIEQLTTNFEDIQFNGDYDGQSHYKVLNVSFPPSKYNDMLLFNLDVAGICASGGSACSSGIDKGSHVIQALKKDPVRTPIRFSFSKYNTKAEIDILIEKLKGILQRS